MNILKNEVDSATDVKDETSGQAESLANKDNEKNTRIIPKKSRLNSSGEEIFDVDEEENSPNIQGTHSSIKPNNWKSSMPNARNCLEPMRNS